MSSTQNLDLVRSIGADHVIDYRNADFVAPGQHHDVVSSWSGITASLTSGAP